MWKKDKKEDKVLAAGLLASHVSVCALCSFPSREGIAGVNVLC